jgi:hypothetical protein
MELTMVLQNDLNSGLMWCGLSGQKLGTLPQNEHMDLSLNLITTVPGLQVTTLWVIQGGFQTSFHGAVHYITIVVVFFNNFYTPV